MLSFYWQKFIAPYSFLVVTALLCFVIASAAGLAAPLVMKFLIDNALAAGDLAYLHMVTAAIVALYFIRGVFSYIYGYVIAKAGNEMLAAMRQQLFVKLQSFDYAYFLRHSTGEILAFFTNDMWLIQQAVTTGIPEILVESLNLVATIIIMIYFDWELALVTFATLPFIIVAIALFNRKIIFVGEVMEQTLAKVSNMLHQSILTVLMVQSYVREEYESEKFTAKIKQAADEALKAQRLGALLLSCVEFLAAMGLTIIIWYGGREVINGKLSMGSMFAFLIYIINVPMPVRKISQSYTQLQMGVMAWGRISAVERQTRQVTDGRLDLPRVQGKVEFRQVSFGYSPDADVLQDIDVTANSGDVVVIVGPSGAGKSSFANLLLRFYDPLAGEILLDDINIRDLRLTDLRRSIGFIQQEPVLFHASILENIRYGKPSASFSQVEQAAKLADAHEFIMQLPQGYNSIVSELGGNLSGGQRQRIAIARAIVMEPAILVFDEPTAALDACTEVQVMSAIRQVAVGRTTFIITHRLSTIINSDQVIYMVNGKIAEHGYHQDLLSRGGQYAQALKSGELGFDFMAADQKRLTGGIFDDFGTGKSVADFAQPGK